MIKNPGSPSGKAWMGVACWLSAGNWQKCLGHMQAFGPLSEDRVLELPGWIMWGSWNTLTCKEKDSVFKAAVKDKMTQSHICYSWTVHLLYFMLFVKDRGDSWKGKEGKHTASISIRDLLMPSAKFTVDGAVFIHSVSSENNAVVQRWYLMVFSFYLPLPFLCPQDSRGDQWESERLEAGGDR